MVLISYWSVTPSDGDGRMYELLRIKGDLDPTPWVKAEIGVMGG